jgi:hypothetical protein
MNMHGPEKKGGTPLSSTGSPGVALLTAAKMVRALTLGAIPAMLRPDYKTPLERYTAGSSISGTYHPTPKPSELTTPLIISRGA